MGPGAGLVLAALNATAWVAWGHPQLASNATGNLSV